MICSYYAHAQFDLVKFNEFPNWKNSNKICISWISTGTTPSLWREEDVESDQAIMNDNDTLQPHVTLNTPLPC